MRRPVRRPEVKRCKRPDDSDPPLFKRPGTRGSWSRLCPGGYGTDGNGLIAKIPRTRRWRVTNYGRKVMGTTMYLREHHFPNVYASVVH